MVCPVLANQHILRMVMRIYFSNKICYNGERGIRYMVKQVRSWLIIRPYC